MTDTLFADVSEFQIEVNDLYPHPFFSFRSNDGSYRDHHFTLNLAWAKHACDAKRTSGFIVYFVFEPGWQQTIAVFKAMVGRPHRRMAVMIDVESWGGKITGDHSAEINAARESLIAWLGGYMSAWQRLKKLHRKRVIGYGNANDLARLWPRRGDAKIVLANYSSNPAFPGKIAHQFSDKYVTPPFGACDINSADGYAPLAFAALLGLTDPPAPTPVKPKPVPKPKPKPKPKPIPKRRTYTVRKGDTFNAIAHRYRLSAAQLHAANPHVHNVNVIYVGEKLIIP